MKVGRKSIFSSAEQEYIQEKYLVMPYKHIADELGYTERQVRGWINNHCNKKNRCFDEHYFDTIDSPNKSYYLGIIYADGWVSNHLRQDGKSASYEFGMQLQRNDRYILEQLNSELGGVHSIKDFERNCIILTNHFPSYTQSSILRIYSKHFVTSLMKHNIATDKSYADIFPIVEDNLFCHFIRGYFDGDGCVYANKYGKPQIHFTAFGDSFLSYIQSKLDSLYGIRSSIYAENENKHRLMIFRKDDVNRFFDVIYGSGCNIKMLRKYNKYITLLGLAA